jgi:hypothetical protein
MHLRPTKFQIGIGQPRTPRERCRVQGESS